MFVYRLRHHRTYRLGLNVRAYFSKVMRHGFRRQLGQYGQLLLGRLVEILSARSIGGQDGAKNRCEHCTAHQHRNLDGDGDIISF